MPDATATLEITGGVLRVYDGLALHGEPFALAMAIVASEGVALLKGMSVDGMTLRRARAVRAALAAAGMHEAVWYRWRNGRRREVRVVI